MRLLAALFILSLALSVAAKPVSFGTAKKRLAKIYADHQTSFYCGCDYQSIIKESGKGKKLAPNWKTCGYSPRKQVRRASRIEWEHVMPAHHFGQHMQCWRDGGRKACRKDKAFKLAAGDMHNLVPAVGEVNGDRSNFKYGLIEGERRVYGRCDAEVDFKARRFEPAPSVRGDIARTYFYMSDYHGIRLSSQQRKLFTAWDKSDPIDEWEREKNRRIMVIQGNFNNFIN